MRCFIPATDDELYAYIARHGIHALVPYGVGMGIARGDVVQASPAKDELPSWVAASPRMPEQEPRLAA